MGIELLIAVLVLAVIVYVVFWLIDAIGLPHPINMVAKAIVAIFAIVYLLRQAGLM